MAHDLVNSSIVVLLFFSIFLVFINLFSNNITVAVNSFSLIRFKMIIQEGFPFFQSSLLVNLNQYRETVGMPNNYKIAYCIPCNTYYNMSLRTYSSFIFLV